MAAGAARYPLHVPINNFQRTFLATGSAFATLQNTYRHDMLAVLSETTSGLFLPPLLRELRSTPSGRQILRDRPRINSSTVDIGQLAKLKDGTLGKEYSTWLAKNKVSPDTRDPVRYVQNPTHAYLLQRYRESHDLYHVLLQFGVSLPSELVVKWFELSNFRLPVALLSGVFGPLRFNPPSERRRLMEDYMAWALKAGAEADCLIGVYWEKEWETPVEELRERFGLRLHGKGMKEWRREGRELKKKREAEMQGAV